MCVEAAMHEPAACFALNATSSSSSSLAAFLGFLSDVGVWLEGVRDMSGEREKRTERTVNRLSAVWKQISHRKTVAADSDLLPIPEGMIAAVYLVDRME